MISEADDGERTLPGGRRARVPRSRTVGVIAAVLLCALFHASHAAVPPEGRPQLADLVALDDYIRAGWTTLARSTRDLAVAATDPKLGGQGGRRGQASRDGHGAIGSRVPIYVSRHENFAAVRARLTAGLSLAASGQLDIRKLPSAEQPITDPGLIYLPRPYVVPGGRFNEMYGWDSYFILRGLLRDGRIRQALDLVDDALYEAVHFGKVLNANRTYYLARSQPPLLSRMVLEVFAATGDRAWLVSTLPALRKQYAYWTGDPHRAGATGLSRYHALGVGPAPEVVAGERDARGHTHYDRVRAALADEPASTRSRGQLYDRRHDRLTPLAYIADRTVRESGFDTSDRFGRFSLDILDYAPVCLNSLLYAMERDIAAILDALGSVGGSGPWRQVAARRAQRVRELMWDPQQGLFLDYDFVEGRRSTYVYATAFFPLWVGLASPEQARRVVQVALPLLLRPGGLVTSTRTTGQQWDAPFGWAPLQLVAFEGMRRYGLEADADQLAIRFIGTVLRVFARTGAIFEKYDVERRAADVERSLAFGYGSNEVGFGWTNGVVRVLEDSLGPAWRSAIVASAAGASAAPAGGATTHFDLHSN